MTFNKCSITGKVYGEIIDKRTGEVLEVNEVFWSFFLNKKTYFNALS